MYTILEEDKENLPDILDGVLRQALGFLDGIDDRPAAVDPPRFEPEDLPEEGVGASGAILRFLERYAPYLSGSAGPRYLGFVTGGSTPAALAGDWLVSAFDQNATLSRDTC